MSRFKICLLGAAASSALVATSAWAQAADTEKVGQLEEVVVVAQRRSQKLQDVPISVNAITENSAVNAGVTGTASLVVAVPSLVMTRQANGATPYLRGVGFASGDINAENSVAIYVDGVYQATAAGNFFEFNNIERIEVLKGPQGTLFGRNATAGVIQVITKEPTFEPAAKVSVGYGNHQTLTTNAYGSIALGEKVAVNAAVMYTDQMSGWGKNLTTGDDFYTEEEVGVRVKALFLPTDNTKIVVAADFSHLKNSAIGAQTARGLSGLPRDIRPGDLITTFDPTLPPGSPAVTIPAPAGSFIALDALGNPFPGKYNTRANYENLADTKNSGVSVNIEHDFGAVQIRSMSAYRDFRGIWQLDQDMSALDIVSARLNEKGQNFQQEIHLLSPSESKLSWLVGANYFYSRSGFLPMNLRTAIGAFGPGVTNLINSDHTIARSYSIFGQATYPIFDDTRLTLGGRYTWDSSHYDSQTDLTIPPLGNVTVFSQSGTRLSYSKPTWRISLDHDFAPDVMGYVSYNRGIKSGNFSAAAPIPAGALYLPEQLDAYEIGLKSELFDHTMRLNAAAFYYDYKNMQFQQIVQGAAITKNAESAKIWGLEGDLEFRPTGNLTITATAAYLHGEFGEFANAPVTYRTSFGVSQPILLVNGQPYNAKGNRLQNAPSFTGSIGASYEIPSSVGLFTVSANVYYTTKYYSEPDNRLAVPAHPLVNAGLSWTHPDGNFSVRLWGKNLSNEYYYAQLTGQAGGTDLGGATAPRTFGITASYKYN